MARKSYNLSNLKLMEVWEQAVDSKSGVKFVADTLGVPPSVVQTRIVRLRKTFPLRRMQVEHHTRIDVNEGLQVIANARGISVEELTTE